MRFLGIDYGAKRIGLALSDEGGKLAFPKEIIQNDGETLERIGAIVRDESIGEMVIGESLDEKGDPNAVMAEIEGFMEKLKGRFSLPVRLQKEFMTSVEGRRYIDDRADARAAALILQRYLDRMNKQ